MHSGEILDVLDLAQLNTVIINQNGGVSFKIINCSIKH